MLKFPNLPWIKKIKKIQTLKQCQPESGFTLIELLVVTMMVGILSAVAITAAFGQVQKAKEVEAVNSNQPSEPMEITVAVELINSKLILGQKIILDLFGGKTSQIPEAINIDLIAESGIKWSIPELLLRLPRESIDEIIASNPQAYFLSDAAPILKPGGRIYINATKRNPFRKLPDADTLEQLGLKVLQENAPLDPRFANQNFFRQTPRKDGTLEIPVFSLKTTILEKIIWR